MGAGCFLAVEKLGMELRRSRVDVFKRKEKNVASSRAGAGSLVQEQPVRLSGA